MWLFLAADKGSGRFCDPQLKTWHEVHLNLASSRHCFKLWCWRVSKSPIPRLSASLSSPESETDAWLLIQDMAIHLEHVLVPCICLVRNVELLPDERAAHKSLIWYRKVGTMLSHRSLLLESRTLGCSGEISSNRSRRRGKWFSIQHRPKRFRNLFPKQLLVPWQLYSGCIQCLQISTIPTSLQCYQQKPST